MVLVGIYHISGPGDLWSLRSLSACYTNALNELKKDNCRTIVSIYVLFYLLLRNCCEIPKR